MPQISEIGRDGYVLPVKDGFPLAERSEPRYLPGMNKLLLIAVLLVMAGVVVALAIGIGSFGKGTRESARLTNRMMWWRIGLQALAVALIFILVTLSQSA